jgi:ABC-type antimicrobial peptide transport system permease subunit
VDFLIRSPRVGSDAFVEELRRALAAVNPNLPLANLRTLQSNYDRSLARTTFSLVILALAGAMALLLGVVGIYGVTAYSVSRRTREIGIRIALGCQRQAVVRLFVREGILLACAGAGCGLLAALAMTQVMSSLLFGVSPIDPVTFGSVLAGLVATAIVASWMPARRAASVDPIHSLRSQ